MNATQEKVTHTPGAWQMGYGDGSGIATVACPDRRTVITTVAKRRVVQTGIEIRSVRNGVEFRSAPGAKGIDWGEMPTVIAEIDDDDDVAVGIRIANARLIAAAPDLLAACKVLVERATPHARHWRDDPQLVQAYAAIAKAEGSAA